VQYEYVQNLADNVSIILLPSNSPFLFDFNELTSTLPQVTTPDETAIPGQ